MGAISAGATSRLLIDYPDPERSSILDYLFKPHVGASVQMLKLEIGGDSDSTDGAEPSVEQSQGEVNCGDGYEWWLAEQAVQRNPKIRIYGLQWGAPGWVAGKAAAAARAPRVTTSSGVAAASPSLWTRADVKYVLAWLGCAKAHGIGVRYLGGWNERFDASTDRAGVTWYEEMRRALDTHGYQHVKLVAADRLGKSRWSVARIMGGDAAFNAAVDVIGVHDNCGFPKGPTADQIPFGYQCSRSRIAQGLNKPLWATEDGRMDANLNAGTLIRELLNGYNQSRITGTYVYPLMTAIADNLPQENRGMVTAKWPWSGQYRVNKITWVMAQVTQFVPQGWNYVNRADRDLGTTGSFNTFESRNRRHWSLVAQNTGASAGEQAVPQTLTVILKGALQHGPVHVWATNVDSPHPSQWMRQLTVVHPSHGTFTYTVPAGDVITFTNRRALVRRGTEATPTDPGAVAPASLPSRYIAHVDASGMPRYLSPLDGSFLYQPCQGRRRGTCLAQTDSRPPVYWSSSDVSRHPEAILGDHTWANYTVGSDVLFTVHGSTAGLIGRFAKEFSGVNTTSHFGGYEFTLRDDGFWALYRNSAAAGRSTLASGTVRAPGIGTWHRLTLRLNGSTLEPTVDGRVVATVADDSWSRGLAGIESGWSNVQYDHLTVK